jgi:hypothetical protein
MVNYWVIATSLLGNDRGIRQQLFATPFQANSFLNSVGGYTNSVYTYEVRPATWREREQLMFVPDPATGEAVYTHAVWTTEQWWKNVASKFRNHFLHVSVLDPTAVAFTEDEAKGEADRQTYMRPGKYLQKFLGAGPTGVIEHGPLKGWAPQVTKMQIAFYAAWHMTGSRPISDDVLAFAETEEEMVLVYEEGPDSCMMGKGWEFSRHPVRVYAGGALRMAYLTSVSGDVVARAICWPDKECFNRVYPTPNSDAQREKYDELMMRLKALGWTSITEDNECFEGALLQRIERGRYGGWLMPYLDHEYGVEETQRDGKRWWRMTHEADHQDSVDGEYSQGEDRFTCDCCEDTFPDNGDYSYTVYTSWRRSGSTGGNGWGVGECSWCESCRDNNAFWCEGSDEHYDHDRASYVEVSGATYERNWFLANDGWECSISERYYFRGDNDPVVLADGSLIHESEVEDGTFVCFYTGLRWPSMMEDDHVPGYHIGFRGWQVHPVEYECVVPAMPDDPADVEAWAAAHPLPDVGIAYLPPPISDLQFEPSLTKMLAQLRPVLSFVTPRSWADINVNS